MRLVRGLIGPRAQHRELVGAVDALNHIQVDLAAVVLAGVTVIAQRQRADLGQHRTDLDVAHGVERRALRQRTRRAERGQHEASQNEQTKHVRALRLAVSLSWSPPQSMIPKKPAPHLMRGAQRFSEKIMLKHQSRTTTLPMALPCSTASCAATMSVNGIVRATLFFRVLVSSMRLIVDTAAVRSAALSS